MKTIATGLLVAAAIVFVIFRAIEETQPWAGYVRATAEAAMVGALADWFAVTAIFRHPLGIPIPHTAIVRNQKDRIGHALGTFVTDNFLTNEEISQQLEGRNLSARAGRWMSEPANARRITEELAGWLQRGADELSHDRVQSTIESVITRQIRQLPVTTLAGRAIDLAVEENHHQELVDSIIVGMGRILQDNKITFRQKLAEESPWWVPEPIDDRIFDKIYDAVNRFVTEVGGNRHHALRYQFDARIVALAAELKESPELRARGEELKEQLLAHPEFRAWIGSLWTSIKESLEAATADPDSELRARLEEWVVELGDKLAHDPATQQRGDELLVEALLFLGNTFRGEVPRYIASAVEKWNADVVEERVELQVGRDLQFIRINGTIIGGLAGLVIYTASELLL